MARIEYPTVSAKEKYAEGPRPLCACHEEPMLWCAAKSFKAGGRWTCRRRHHEARAERRRVKGAAYRAAEYRRDRLREYGLSVKEYDDLLEHQGGTCALCPRTDADGRLCIDHDHETERVRGILCVPCNYAIERILDDPVWGMRALAYLR